MPLRPFAIAALGVAALIAAAAPARAAPAPDCDARGLARKLAEGFNSSQKYSAKTALRATRVHSLVEVSFERASKPGRYLSFRRCRARAELNTGETTDIFYVLMGKSGWFTGYGMAPCFGVHDPYVKNCARFGEPSPNAEPR